MLLFCFASSIPRNTSGDNFQWPGTSRITKLSVNPAFEKKTYHVQLVQLSGQVRPRQGTEICNFGAPSPLEALHWIFSFFSSIDVQFSKTSPLKSGESSEKSSEENRVKSCHVCGCHGFFGPETVCTDLQFGATLVCPPPLSTLLTCPQPKPSQQCLD